MCVYISYADKVKGARMSIELHLVGELYMHTPSLPLGSLQIEIK
jgi:hypothetical protein